MLLEALELLDGGTVHPLRGAVLLEPEDAEFSPLERRFADAFFGGSPTIPLKVAGNGGARVDVFHALGEEAELRRVFRSIIDDGLPFEKVQVLFTGEERYLPVIHSLCRSFGVPAAFGCGVPAGAVRAGKAALALLEWVEQGYPVSGLIKMLLSGLVKLAPFSTGAEESPSRTYCVSLLRKARPALDCRCLEPEGKDERAGLIKDALRLLLHKAPDVSAYTLSFGALVSSIRRILEKGLTVYDPDEAAAKSDVLELLRSMQGIQRDLPPLKATRRLRGIVKDLMTGAGGPLPGRVHFDSLSAGRAFLRERTFVVGLDAGSFPGAAPVDPILLDSERRELSAHIKGDCFPLLSEESTKRRKAAERLLDSLEGRVTCSYSVLDGSGKGGDSGSGPSALFLEMARRAFKKKKADFDSLSALMGEPAGLASREGCPDERELWLHLMRKRGFDVSLFELAGERFPWLADGRNAEVRRRSDGVTEFDGRLTKDDDRDPRVNKEPLSASRLERFFVCPLRFFFESVLRAEVVDEREPDPGTWLDHKDRGSLLHEIFDLFVKELARRKERPSVNAHAVLLDDIMADVVNRWKKACPPPSGMVFDREAEDIREVCGIFLRSEEDRCSSLQPAFSEASFGLGTPPEQGAPGSENPVEITLSGGSSFFLRGSIDRMDRQDDGNWRIRDYKTGAPFVLDSSDPLENGRRLQYALYVRAADILLKNCGFDGTVADTGYLFPGQKGQGRDLSLPADTVVNALDGVLAEAFDTMREGLFSGSADKKVCGYCDWAKLCRWDPGNGKRIAPAVGDDGTKGAGQS
ncbi:MAG: PD-(D/E)XK nuclease family protein [Synergistaceae bacterium]|nr:PD-(D/E)XK nuclease family protein [Synergistaceae bacterium]